MKLILNSLAILTFLTTYSSTIATEPKTAEPEKNVTIAILAKDKEHVLDLYLACIEHQTWPAAKTNLYIRTNNNNDKTAHTLREWVRKVSDRYAKIYFDDTDVKEQVQKYEQHTWNSERFRVLAKIRQDSVQWAHEQNSHYFVADCDNFIKPHTIETLVKANLPIVAPLLVTCNPPGSGASSHRWYSNYHDTIDERGYLKECDSYHKILRQETKELLLLPVVHCTYLIRYETLPEIAYNDGSNDHEYIIFSRNARKKNIAQYLDNREIYGYLTFTETKATFAQEPWIEEIKKWHKKKFETKAAHDSLLAVVLMVKNEAPVMVKTLQPFVEGGVKNFLIFDTGSTDGTQEIARDYFKKEGLAHAYVLEEPFIDFATSRNHALIAAESLFSEITFIIMPDAEWYIQGVEDLMQFCAQEKNSSDSCYSTRIEMFNVDGTQVSSFVVPKLLRTSAHNRFVGAIHEYLNQPAHKTVPVTSYFKYQPSAQGFEKTAQRCHRDKMILLKELEQNPENSRTLFFLGQTYAILDDWKNAYIYYKKRAATKTFHHEETFATHLRLGDVAQQFFSCENKSIHPTALGHYLEAYALSPERAEPLIKIARYYLDLNQMHLAFLFAMQAVKIPQPSCDAFCFEKEKYTYTRYDTLGICAWYVQEYELGEWAVRKALEVMPDAPHLHHNLKLYLDRKASLNNTLLSITIE